MTLVTVAIPTHNRAGPLRGVLEGLARQDFPAARFEVLVVDNGSTDDTPRVVAEFAGARPAPRRVPEPRQGLDFARNRALAEARGSIVLFADDDILVEPDWIARMAEAFEADPGERIGAVGGEVIPVFPDGLPAWVAEWHAPLAFRPDLGPIPAERCPMGANLAIRMSAIARAGPFHPGLDRSGGRFFSGGDSDMIRRLRAAGYEIWFAPGAAVRHRMPAARTTFRYAARHAFDSARSRVIDRSGRPGALRYLLGRWAGNAVKAAGLALWGLLNLLVFRPGAAKKALVRSWRACGYLYQVPRSLFGKI